MNKFVASAIAILLAGGSVVENEDRKRRERREERLVTICHFPPGNPSAMETIRVARRALRSHLRHGDTIGPCDASPSQPR